MTVLSVIAHLRDKEEFTAKVSPADVEMRVARIDEHAAVRRRITGLGHDPVDDYSVGNANDCANGHVITA